jgi:protein-L-isoaspartate(D-aspartate) O-methyltransferase
MFWQRLLNRGDIDPGEDARREMVERQLRPHGITDGRVLAAMGEIPRERFVPPERAGSAYEDRALAIAEGQTISQPFMVALMSQELAVPPGARVLEIGTGSGYQAAVLSRLVGPAGRVVTVERHEPLSRAAERLLGSMGFENVEFRVGDGTVGAPDAAPFDRIMVTAGGPELPMPLVAQLAPGGRLLAPVGDRARQMLTALDLPPDGSRRITEICPCVFVDLVGRHGWPE